MLVHTVLWLMLIVGWVGWTLHTATGPVIYDYGEYCVYYFQGARDVVKKAHPWVSCQAGTYEGRREP